MTEKLPPTSLRLGVPSGSLQNATVDLFAKAGYRISIADRSVFPRVDDDKIAAVLFRAQEISRYVSDGIIDCGLTGHDWVVENGNEKDVVEICELEYSRASRNPAKWVLAVPEESDIKKPEDLDGKIIATELVNTTKRYFEQKGIKVTVEFSWGTTEIKARLLDGIVDITETGSSIRANNLRIIDTILSSTTRFIANKDAWAVPWKREKMENLAMLLKGAIEAKAKVGLKMNVPRTKLPEVVSFLPAEKSPTVSSLSDADWVAVEVILEDRQERELIPRLEMRGSDGNYYLSLEQGDPVKHISRCLGVGLVLFLGVAGSAARTGGGQTPTARGESGAASTPTTQSSDPNARLTLDEIEPKPTLAAPRPSTRPSEKPSLDALTWFARARDALLQNQRYTAIDYFGRAIALDPDSYDLHFALGRAYMGLGQNNDKALTEFQTAAAIKPDDLEVQIELGRAYQARQEPAKAIEHFRMAMLTSAYRDGDSQAGVVDYRLAVALEQRGYDRAALECYLRLLNRVEHASISPRTAPEVSYLAMRPELLLDEIAKLYEKQGNYAEALKLQQKIAEAAPNDFGVRARVVRTLARLKRSSEATAAAADVVRTFHANAESIQLLREIHEQVGTRSTFADVLAVLHRENPRDRSILFALAETLAASGQMDRAQRLLIEAIDTHNGNVEVVQRLYTLLAERDQVADAAKLIIVTSAKYPDTTSELETNFVDLMRLSRKNSLRLPAVQKLEIPASAEPARQFWIWRLTSETRPSAGRVALEQSVKADAPFDPACRAQLDVFSSRTDIDAAAKEKLAQGLIDHVSSHGRPDLAAELRGLLALRNGANDRAVQALGDAVRLSALRQPSPDLQLEYALAVLANGNSPRFEQMMWKLLSDRPHFDAAYQFLYRYFKDNNAEAQAWNVLNTWLAADPNNVAARVQQALELVGQRRGEEALIQVRRLFEQRPDDLNVVRAMILLLNAAGQQQQSIDLLEAERAKRPANRIAVEALMEMYSRQNRPADAQRVIDAARTAVAEDPDLLYYVAHLYQRIDQPKTTELVLEQVLKIDPTHAQAGNDLGYTWADEGRNLERAEQLIRIAVTAEPDNPSFLDSLGWVLYKRGSFDEALKLLQQATEPMDTADPIVLDHLGDALYRLNRHPDARTAWQKSLDRIGNEPQRQDLVKLKVDVQIKLTAEKAGQPVNVAPVVDGASRSEQAKN